MKATKMYPEYISHVRVVFEVDDHEASLPRLTVPAAAPWRLPKVCKTDGPRSAALVADPDGHAPHGP